MSKLGWIGGSALAASVVGIVLDQGARSAHDATFEGSGMLEACVSSVEAEFPTSGAEAEAILDHAAVLELCTQVVTGAINAVEPLGYNEDAILDSRCAEVVDTLREAIPTAQRSFAAEDTATTFGAMCTKAVQE